MSAGRSTGSTAEKHFGRALELDPNSVDTHWMYAHLPSNAGRHAEALAAMARARSLDPLSGLINAMEGQMLLHAGQTDDAIDRLRDAIELEPRSRVAHLFAASAYIEKGLFDDAAAEAGAARVLTPANTRRSRSRPARTLSVADAATRLERSHSCCSCRRNAMCRRTTSPSRATA